MMRPARRCVLALLCLACGFAPAHAQRSLLGPGAAFVAAGGTRVETSELDDWLAARSYPTFGRAAVALGLGGYRTLSNGVMLGVEAQGLIIGSESHEDGVIGLGGGYATLGVGYAFEVSPRVRFYPRLGVGPGGMALWVEEDERPDFDDALAGGPPGADRSPNLSRDGVVVDLGAGAELLFARSGGVLVGLRAGYLMGPLTDRWETYESEVSGGPHASIAGPYVRILAGWGWR